MGFLRLFSKPVPTLHRLPSGSFTVDREGTLLTSTLPSSFPAGVVRDIAQHIRTAFAEAAAAQLPLTELTLHYTSLRISARELRGGAIVFLSPQTRSST